MYLHIFGIPIEETLATWAPMASGVVLVYGVWLARLLQRKTVSPGTRRVVKPTGPFRSKQGS